MTQLEDPEDKKLVTLARSARARTGAAEGACVRDLDGRTYAGATVDLPSLRLSALQVVLGEGESVGDDDLSVVRDFAGSGVPVHLASPAGALVITLTA
jgi:hypothetical protein